MSNSSNPFPHIWRAFLLFGLIAKSPVVEVVDSTL
jgi:hypothetical protein